MNKHQRTKLEGILESLSKADRDRVYELAREQRSAAQKRRKSKARETEDGERIGGKRRADPLIDWVLRIVEKDYGHAQRLNEQSTDEDTTMQQGRVVELTRRRATVLADSERDVGNAVHCRLSAELASRQQSGIAVGDRVVFDTLDAKDDDEDLFEVVSVLERRTKLARPDAHDPRVERVVAANVDVVVVVVSVVSPPLHPRLIDRYLVAIEAGGCEAVIAVNKVDLLDDTNYESELRKLDPYREAGIPIAVCAAVPGDDSSSQSESRVDELRSLLGGKTCAFVGHSGVGKSSLANALHPELMIETGRVRERDQRGRHTTTSSAMHFIDTDKGEDAEIRVIDTPGVRFFGLADVTPEELRWMFPEFVDLVHDCKFNDCSHEHEPECAVKAAVERGEISSVRYETYVRLLEELRNGGKPKDVTERIRPSIDWTNEDA
ncbi:MAG: ribosome small subunit-dependent GTPase A [Phycisphaerales bacterium]